MKRKVLYLLVLVSCLMFVGILSAKAVAKTYEDLEIGEEIIYNADLDYECDSLSDSEQCKVYTVTEDNGDSFKATDGETEITINKDNIVDAIVAISTEELDIPIEDEDGLDDFEPESLIEVHYFRRSKLDAAVEYANERSAEDGIYANIYNDFLYSYGAEGGKLVIGPRTTLTAYIYEGVELVNNGTVKVCNLMGAGISGPGRLVLFFYDDEEDEIEDQVALINVDKFSGKVDLRNTKSYDNARIILTNDEESSEDIFNQINDKVKIDGYKMKLEKKEVTEDDYFYYQIVFVKDETNPKTSDSILTIISVMVLSMASFVIAFRKTRKYN